MRTNRPSHKEVPLSGFFRAGFLTDLPFFSPDAALTVAGRALILVHVNNRSGTASPSRG
jgi:hypothetical protein